MHRFYNDRLMYLPEVSMCMIGIKNLSSTYVTFLPVLIRISLNARMLMLGTRDPLKIKDIISKVWQCNNPGQKEISLESIST